MLGFILPLLGYHVYLVGTNQTTKEYATSREGENPYDRGVLANCGRVLGRSAYKTFYEGRDVRSLETNAVTAKYVIRDEMGNIKQAKCFEFGSMRMHHSLELTPTDNSGKYKVGFVI
jgi:hypothetical protein